MFIDFICSLRQDGMRATKITGEIPRELISAVENFLNPTHHYQVNCHGDSWGRWLKRTFLFVSRWKLQQQSIQ